MITSVVALAKILKAPSPAPNPTVKTLLVISPTLKLELATVGCVASLGKSVRYPAPAGTTVMLPVTAAASAGTPTQAVRAGSVKVEPCVIGVFGLLQPGRFGGLLRVSSRRT